MGSISLLLAAYVAVLVAEIAGDKLLYTSGILATRYRTAPVLSGMALAFASKMGVAVAIGSAISRLPRVAVATATALSFAGVAYALWQRPTGPEGATTERPSSAARGAALTFTAIFLSEWGDVGQVTAAALTARYGAPLLVWAAAVGAMVTKGAVAVTIGAALRAWIRRRIPPSALRYSGALVMAGVGIAALLEEFGLEP